MHVALHIIFCGLKNLSDCNISDFKPQIKTLDLLVVPVPLFYIL